MEYKRNVDILFEQNMLSIVSNITDTFAQTGKPLTKKWIDILDFIFKEIDFDIEGFADGNDCGGCDDWAEYISEIRRLMLTGDRIHANSITPLIDVYDWITGNKLDHIEDED